MNCYKLKIERTLDDEKTFNLAEKKEVFAVGALKSIIENLPNEWEVVEITLVGSGIYCLNSWSNNMELLGDSIIDDTEQPTETPAAPPAPVPVPTDDETDGVDAPF